MKKQRGVSLTGLMVFSVILIIALLFGFKLFKPYSEYFALQKIFKILAAKPELKTGTRRDVMTTWASYATIEGITSISGDDLEITKDGNSVTVSAAYQSRIPLFKNYTLLIDFNPTSTGP
ncbi:MAG: hypothetical protein JWN94_2553 [Betaproteobacteria bacterium]|nr:hypothetical protein [Betaproteobacteria bacterium]